jgi:hypothetical protein
MWNGLRISGVETFGFYRPLAGCLVTLLVALGVCTPLSFIPNIARCFPVCLYKFYVQPSEKRHNLITFCCSPVLLFLGVILFLNRGMHT